MPTKKNRAKYMREWRKKNPDITKAITRRYSKKRRKLIKDKRERIVKLLGGKCSKCGYDKCIEALELHHKDPKTKESSWRRNVRFEIMVKEAKKCRLLCANCHRETHYAI